MKIEFAQEKSEYEVHLETIIIVLVVIASYCFTVQYIIRWVAYFILLKFFFFLFLVTFITVQNEWQQCM